MADDTRELPIEPHPETQMLLLRVLHPAPDEDDVVHWRNLGRLLSLSRDDGQRFVRQIVLMDCNSDEKILNTKLYQLLQLSKVTDVDRVFAMAPFAYHENDNLRRESRRVLRSATSSGKHYGYRDFSNFLDAVNDDFQKTETTKPLRRFMFELSPASAFLSFHYQASALERFELQRAERTISSAIVEAGIVAQQREYVPFAKARGLIPQDTPDVGPWVRDDRTTATLRSLAHSKYWWARLFVAEVMVQHRELRDDQLIELLGKDKDELVHGSIASLRAPDPLRVTKVDH